MTQHKKTWQQRAISWFARGVVILVALGAAVLSFDALTALAVAAGIDSSLAWVWAIVVDGFILVATVAAFSLKERGWRVTWYPWVTLSLFVILSMIGNGYHAAIAEPDYRLPLGVAVIVTAIPPIALFLAIHMLIVMSSPSEEEKKERERQANLKARKQRIEDKKLDREEKAAEREAERAEKELLREQNAPLTAATRSRQQKAVESISKRTFEAPVLVSEPITSPRLELDAPAETPVINPPVTAPEQTIVESSYLTEEQTIQRILETAENGRIMTGQEVADLLGKSLRTGQGLMKKVKEANPDLFATGR